MSILTEALFSIGMIFIVIGALYDVIAAIGMLRFQDFYLRAHAATVGAIGGAVLPIFGAGLVALVSPWLGDLRYFLTGIALTTGVLLLLTAPTGAHSIVSAVYFGRIGKPPRLVVDQLAEDIPRREDVAELVLEHEEVMGEEEKPIFRFRRR